MSISVKVKWLLLIVHSVREMNQIVVPIELVALFSLVLSSVVKRSCKIRCSCICQLKIMFGSVDDICAQCLTSLFTPQLVTEILYSCLLQTVMSRC